MIKSVIRYTITTSGERPMQMAWGQIASILFYFFTFCLFWAGNTYSQDPLFTAAISATRVVQNSVLEVQFELKNARGEDFQPPSFSDFEVVAGPVMGSSTVIVNGQISRGQSWTYSLLAKKTGEFTIGSAYVIAGRKKLATRPMAIEVLAPKDLGNSTNPQQDGASVILVTEVADKNYYPGQQIVVNYKLLFRENVQTVNTVSEDDYSDFFIQNFGSISPQATYENINGLTYTARIIKSIALFAHQSGDYTIDPLVIDVGINVPYPVNQGFFTMRRLKNVQVVSDPASIKVLPLPTPVPEAFSGAVGNYSLTAKPGLVDLTTDDDFSVQIEIIGDGDARRWDPPLPVTEGEFELYDPRIEENILNESNGVIVHSRIIEYRMIPQEAGEFNVYLPFTFFNPASGKYETIHSDTFRLSVAQGSGLLRSVVNDSIQAPPPVRKVNQVYNHDQFWKSPAHLVLFGLILIGGFWGGWISLQKKRESEIPESEKNRSVAGRHARQELDQLHAQYEILQDKEVFERATEIYYQFLTRKFNIPHADLDKQHLVEILGRNKIPDEVMKSASDFFEQSLSVRYGASPGGRSKEEMIAATKEQVEMLDKS